MNKIRNRMKKVADYELNEKASELTKYVVNEFIEYYIGYFEQEKGIQLDAAQKEKIASYVLELDSYGASFSIDKIDNSVASRVEEWIDSEVTQG